MGQIDPRDIVAAGDDDPASRDMLSILWAITKGCNFSCSYCVYTKPLRETVFTSAADLLRAARTIERLARPAYQITLYGGEPTLHPHFLNLLAYFVASGTPAGLRMYSNGSRSLAFFEKMLAVVKNYDFRVIFSFHPEFARFSTFKRNLELVAGAGMSVAASYMFVPARREAARQHIDELLALRQGAPFFMSLNYPHQPDGKMGVGCTDADREWITNSRAAFENLPMPGHLASPFYTRITNKLAVMRAGERVTLPPGDSLQFLSAMQTRSYTGFHCCGGTNVMFVEEDGTTRGGVCSASPYLGNLFHDDEITLLQAMRPVRCTASVCSSIENIPLPKFRDQAEAEACVQAFRNRAKGYFYNAEATRLT